MANLYGTDTVLIHTGPSRVCDWAWLAKPAHLNTCTRGEFINEEECTHAVHQGNCFVVLSDRFQRNGEPVSPKKRGKRPHQRRGADEQKMLAVQLSPAASNERVLRI